MGKSGTHNLTAGFKKLLDAFGMHWREAEGEAEAELAFLNRAGAIDAVMTDDVDCFLFGAVTVIKKCVSFSEVGFTTERVFSAQSKSPALG